MNKMQIELKNNFHNTSAKLNVSDLRIAEELGNGNDYFCTITATQMQRAARKLCGMKDCTCGTVRGPQTHNGRKLLVMRETQHGLVQI